MVTASRIQNMVQMCKKAAISICFTFLLLGLSASRAPAQGPYSSRGLDHLILRSCDLIFFLKSSSGATGKPCQNGFQWGAKMTNNIDAEKWF